MSLSCTLSLPFWFAKLSNDYNKSLNSSETKLMPPSDIISLGYLYSANIILQHVMMSATEHLLHPAWQRYHPLTLAVGGRCGVEVRALTLYSSLKEFEVRAPTAAQDSQQLLQHINLQDPHIQFTIEEPNQEGALPFLDTLVSPGPINMLVTTTESQHILTNIYTGTATISLQWKIVFPTL